MKHLFRHNIYLSVLCSIVLSAPVLAQTDDGTTTENETPAEQEEAKPIDISVALKGVDSWTWKKDDDYVHLPISFVVNAAVEEKQELTFSLSHSVVYADEKCGAEQLDSMLLTEEVLIAVEPTEKVKGEDGKEVHKKAEQKLNAAVHLFKSEKLKCSDELMYLKIEFALESEQFKLSNNSVQLKMIPIEKKAEPEKKKDEGTTYTTDFAYDAGRYKATYTETKAANTLLITKYGGPTKKEQAEEEATPPEKTDIVAAVEEATNTLPPERTLDQGASGSTSNAPTQVTPTPQAKVLIEKTEPAKNEGTTLGGTNDVELFQLAFKEAFYALDDSKPVTELSDLDKHANTFQTEINKKKAANKAKEINKAFAEGFKTAQDEIDGEKAIPAGKLQLKQNTVNLYNKDQKKIGSFEVENVVVSVNNGVIDQLNIYGEASIDKQSQSTSNKDGSSTTETVFLATSDDVHFYNNRWAISPKSFMKKKPGILSTRIYDGKRNYVDAKLYLSDLLEYASVDSNPLSQRIRPICFEIDQDERSHVIKRHKFTDYVSSALYSDILGLSGAQPNSLFLSDVSLDYPLNAHASGWFTLFPSVEIILNLARIGNDENSIKASNGQLKDNDAIFDSVQFVNVFDYLQYYSLYNYAGLTAFSAEIKAIESRFEGFAGYTTFRTLVEFDYKGTTKKSSILSPAFTFGGRFRSSLLDNKMGFTLDGRAFFLTPTKENEFIYTASPKSLSEDPTHRVTKRDKFWLMTFEAEAYWRRPTMDKIFAKFRWFDSFDTRDAYMQFLVGYSVPLSTLVKGVVPK